MPLGNTAFFTGGCGCCRRGAGLAEAGGGATEMGLLGAQIQARGGRDNGWTVGLRALQGLHRRDRSDQRCSRKQGEGTTKQTNHRPECRGVVFDLATAREKRQLTASPLRLTQQNGNGYWPIRTRNVDHHGQGEGAFRGIDCCEGPRTTVVIQPFREYCATLNFSSGLLRENR